MDSDPKTPPSAFRDTEGRTWMLAIDVKAIKRVRALAGVEIKTWADDKFKSFAAVLSDVETLCNVLFALVTPEAERLGVTDEAFAAALGGDALEAGRDALVVAFANFCPSQARPLILALKAKGREYVDLLVKEGLEKLRALDLPSLVEQTLRSSAGNSPASSESMPGP